MARAESFLRASYSLRRRNNGLDATVNSTTTYDSGIVVVHDSRRRHVDRSHYKLTSILPLAPY